MNILRGLRLALPTTSLVAALASCGGSSGGGFGNGGSGGGDGGASGSPVSLGGGTGGSGVESCSNTGSTRSCCVTGTQTCGGGESKTWGPCLDPKGAILTCPAPGLGGGGSEDAGGPGLGGGGSEDGGSLGLGGGGHEDAALPPTPPLCLSNTVNTEPEILVGYLPASGQTVGAHGQIKIWVNDEGAPFTAPNEQIDPNTGAITTPGDRTQKAPDGYLWEPALYIAPQTAETGGTPHFPTAIKGDYNNQPPNQSGGTKTIVPIDPAPAGSTLAETFTAEDIWDVSSLGLAPGTYVAEFVIHDGDDDRAVGCVNIVITPN